MIGLGEYIMKELGYGVYDELEIDPSDYDSLPAYDFYDEVVSSCRVVHPEIIERYYRETEKRNMPSSEKEFREYQNLKIRRDFPLALRMAVDIMVHTGDYRLSIRDYANLRYYTGALLNFIRNKKPEDIERYLLDHPKETLPGTDINCNRMRQFVLYLAQRYKEQYEA